VPERQPAGARSKLFNSARRAQNRNGCALLHVSRCVAAKKKRGGTEDASIDCRARITTPTPHQEFCEHMANQSCPTCPERFPPRHHSGDSRAGNLAFDMVQASTFWRRCLFILRHQLIDIAPANYVGKAIVTIHQKEAPAHASITVFRVGSQTYHE